MKTYVFSMYSIKSITEIILSLWLGSGATDSLPEAAFYPATSEVSK